MQGFSTIFFIDGLLRLLFPFGGPPAATLGLETSFIEPPYKTPITHSLV